MSVCVSAQHDLLEVTLPKILAQRKGRLKMTTWQQELKACARRYHAKKKRAAAKAAPKAKPAPPKVPMRIRGKQQDPTRDIN